MESTQNNIYEIEESALVDQNLKNGIDDDNQEENKNGMKTKILKFDNIDYDVYADQFEENAKLRDGIQIDA